ncbi:MAG: NfeD family protein [Pseudomonadota bacterium]
MNALLEHFSQHHDHLLYAMACVCLLLELGVLGMSGPLIFIALGCIATGLLITFNLIHGWDVELLMVSVLAIISAAGLWKPLKSFQNSGGGPDTSSDMIGKSLPVTFTITHEHGRVSYSGIEWQARLAVTTAEPIAIASRALVVGVDGSLLMVKTI